MTRLFGSALILGGTLVGGVLVWVLSAYRQQGQVSDGWLLLIGLIVAVALVLPQLGLGIYFWRSARPPKDAP